MKYLQILHQAEKNKKINAQKLIKLSKAPKQVIDEKINCLHEEVFKNIDCLQCANCCKTTSPIITRRDIERISKALKMKAGDFIFQYLLVDEDEDYVFKTAPCPFLNLENNYCNIYEIRPNACATYPHTDRKNMKEILNLTLKNASVCPAVASILESL